MLTRSSRVVLVALLAALPVVGDDATVKTKLSLQYWRCIKPVAVTCTALSDRDFDRCPQCQEWGAYVSTRLIQGTISEAVYIDRQKTANQFINDVLVDFYHASPEVAARYTPYKVAALYDNPRAFGWVELPRPQAGCLVIDRHTAAFALQDLPAGTLGRGPLTLKRILKNPSLVFTMLHSSAKRNGALSVSDAKYLFPKAAPKSLLPDFIIEEATSEPTEVIPVGWNAWLEEPPGPRYEPIRHLRPQQKYNLAIHTAPFAYEIPGFATLAGPRVQERLGAQVRRTRATNIQLTAVALTDETFLRLRSNVYPFRIDIKKLRDWDNDDAPPEVPAQPLKALASGADPRWVFAELLIPVETAAREGRTSIGISIWDADAWPIDEFTIPVCIAQPDRAPTVCQPGDTQFSDITSFDVGAPIRPTPPAAALHLVSFGDGVTGLFHRGDTKGAPYIAWRISDSEDQFVAQLAHIAEQFARAQHAPDELARAGDALYGAVFALTDPLNAPARRAQAAFEEFARRPMAATPRTGAEAPTLFIRFLTNRRRTRLVPFGLARLGEGSRSFVGMHFRVEMPLAHRSTEPSTDCIANWTFVIPAANAPEFPGVRAALEERLPHLHEANIIEDMSAFRDLLSLPVEDSTTRALAVLSHHETNHGVGSLSFEPLNSVTSLEVRRQFCRSTVALVNACGTGEPGGEDFIHTLNQHGVDTIITTSHAVTPRMAVEYFDCLSAQLPSRAKDAQDLSVTHFQAVQCLAQRTDETGEPYGAAALAYGLAGDGTARLCQPRR